MVDSEALRESSPVATVSPLTTLRAATPVMLERKTGWLVVTRLDDGQGSLTSSDRRGKDVDVGPSRPTEITT